MTLLEALMIWAIEIAVVSALGARRTGAVFGLLVAGLLLLVPVFVTAPPIQRGMLTFGFEICFVRSAQLALKPLTGSFGARLLYIFLFVAFVDTRSTAKVRPRVDGPSALTILFAAIVGLAAILSWHSSANLLPLFRYPVRFIAGTVLIFATVEIMASFMRFLTGLIGITLPPLHDSPYRSRSLSDFWGKRWNIGAATALRALCFTPLTHHSLVLALLATFAASAVLHAYIALVALGAQPALMWTAFFLVQPLLILFEHQLRVRRWPYLLRSTWVASALILTAPLLVAPLLRFFNIRL